MKILNPEDTARALPYDKLVPAIAQAARELGSGAINAPERMVVNVGSAGVLLCMPALGADIGVTKLITVHGRNPQNGLPAIQGEVVVFDAPTGRRLALLDGPTVTARRTAAVTLLGIQSLMPARPSSALLIGTGVQAMAHAEALAVFFGVSRFQVASRDPAHAQKFCEALMQRHPQLSAVPQSADEARNAVPDADVVIALTTSTVPVVPAQLRPDTLAVGVGAFKPEMAELPPQLLHSRAVVVDDLAGAKHEAGDLLQAGIDWSKVRDLGSVVTQGWDHRGPLPVLKTVGQAAWDLAAARVAVASVG